MTHAPVLFHALLVEMTLAPVARPHGALVFVHLTAGLANQRAISSCAFEYHITQCDGNTSSALVGSVEKKETETAYVMYSRTQDDTVATLLFTK